jgi:hypothetical protein
MSEEQSQRTPESPSESDALQGQWIRPEGGIYEGYTDYLHINWTALNVRFRCGQIVPNPDDPPDKARWAIEEHFAFRMPWFHAKVMRDMLADAIARYEKANGEITLPEMPP